MRTGSRGKVYGGEERWKGETRERGRRKNYGLDVIYENKTNLFSKNYIFVNFQPRTTVLA